MPAIMQGWNGYFFVTGSSEDLLPKRVVVIEGEILRENSLEVIAKLLYLDDQDSNHPIYLNLDSPGGCIGSSFAVLDTIRGLRAPVHTVCLAFAAGTAALIVAAGRPGWRFARRTAILSLSASTDDETSPVGQAELHRIDLMLADELAMTTHKARDLILDGMGQFREFTPSEALEFGLIDQLIE